ncbi:M15 family metallopeptidase [Aquihabitans sp. G128]|uniref:M15 family metallopeptidase n=1 Tax=Aquihabitans sp. G128 TaxID=2849779 RepID=UPI001C215A4F|nr:M15 family metallopeptidase [Aquihabitans sp. G128]QXC61241.1 M15 family metallopeptidase [Aquihabitans sp. G128]
MRLRTTTRPRQLLAVAAIGLVALAGTACEPTRAEPPTGTSTTTTTIPAPATTKVTCASGSTITVATSIAGDVKALLAAAKADGLKLCGGGFRTADAQIAVRKANCGTTYYDIWQKPSSQCSPPTAIPGTSMHERGLAIDFTSCDTRTTACYKWLAANAADFGLQNLPSEPWHWSTNGR